MSLVMHSTLLANDGKIILWEGLAMGSPGKQQEFKLSAPAGDMPADTCAVFRTPNGATVTIAR